MRKLFVLLSVLCFSLAAGQSSAAQPAGKAFLPEPDKTDQLIVKMREQPGKAGAGMNPATLDALNAQAGMPLQALHVMSQNAWVMALPHMMPLAEATAVANRLASDPEVEYAEPDRLMRRLALPNDTLFGNQWYDQTPVNEPGGVNLPPAWDITTGSPAIVVAVLDTGILPHVDLVGRSLPGYDFISDPVVANDGNGRDSDPADPGDWITAAESAGATADGTFEDCLVSDSSWHGTHVGGLIGAATNNARGIAGSNWSSLILPVRVLGKCFGYESDVIDGSRWAAGLSVPGVPANPRPANVLNMSLGNPGFCGRTAQQAINEIVLAGKVVVAATGNDNASAADNSPANCDQVIDVGASDRDGRRAFYSDFGPDIDVSAPGGAQRFENDPNGILSTYNTGTTIPAADDYRYLEGTSFAAAQVSGIAALVLSVKPTLTPAEVRTILRSTARPFAAGSGCGPGRCGTGIVDAAAAVTAARDGLPATGGSSGRRRGGGGCAIDTDSRFDPVLLLLALAAVVMIRRRA